MTTKTIQIVLHTNGKAFDTPTDVVDVLRMVVDQLELVQPELADTVITDRTGVRVGHLSIQRTPLFH